MNFFSGFLSFLATQLAIIGFVCFMLVGLSLTNSYGGFGISKVFVILGMVLVASSIFVFSTVVRRWRSGRAKHLNDLREKIKSELREEILQDSYRLNGKQSNSSSN